MAPYFDPIWLAYIRQIRQSHCFDIDDHPGSPVGASVGLLAPSHDFSGEAELLMELAKRAILEYNEKECNVFKYKVLKIEKVNYTVTAYYQYWMTVKVLNLTLSTPIETFQVHAHKSILIDDDDEVIYCCRPKEEEIEHLISSSARTRTQVVVGVKFNSSALLDRREVVLLRGSNNFSVTAITTSHGRGSSVVPTLKITVC